MQFDADTVGGPGVPADAEMCMMMADTMEALGIQRGQYVIRVNNRKVLNGVLDLIFGFDSKSEDAVLSAVYDTERQKDEVLRAVDKYDKFGREGVQLLLTTGREDA